MRPWLIIAAVVAALLALWLALDPPQLSVEVVLDDGTRTGRHDLKMPSWATALPVLIGLALAGAVIALIGRLEGGSRRKPPTPDDGDER